MRFRKFITTSAVLAGALTLATIGLAPANAVPASTPICADSVQKALSNRSGTSGTYRVTGMTSTTDLLNCANPALSIATNTSANDVWDYYLSFSPASFGALTPYYGNQITVDITGSPDANGFDVWVVDTATNPATVFQQSVTFSRGFGQTQSGPQTKSLSFNLSPTQITHLMNGDFELMVNFVGSYTNVSNSPNVDTITSISLAGYSASTPSSTPSSNSGSSSAGSSGSSADDAAASPALASTGADESGWILGLLAVAAGVVALMSARVRARADHRS